MKKINKPIYETPHIIPLGELARGAGVKPVRTCLPGSGAKDGCGIGSGGPPKKNDCIGGAGAKKCLSGAGG